MEQRLPIKNRQSETNAAYERSFLIGEIHLHMNQISECRLHTLFCFDGSLGNCVLLFELHFRHPLFRLFVGNVYVW